MSGEAVQGSETFPVGHGKCIRHHGEFLQGCFWDDESRTYVPGLVTVPIPEIQTHAVFHPDDAPGIRVSGDRPKSARAAALTLEACQRHGGTPPPGGVVDISSQEDRGWGMGSSTSDVIATVRAVCSSCGVDLSRWEISRLAVRAEVASDPLAFESCPVLFAQRHARLLRQWQRPFPPLALVGCRLSREPVNTLAMHHEPYSRSERREFHRLRREIGRAITRGDPRLLGRVATRSAEINQRRVHQPGFDEVLEICRSVDGVGVQIAHSGNVCGLLLDDRSPGTAHKITQARDALTRAGFPPTLERRSEPHHASC
ncbi:hypothetical protein [Kocuria massiliensis]|uniref:GHMP family kinase ATP-binding protein n=1 Tax=Kocuria massiliensis TaxID=1926282 RepID=UPI001301F7F9|nr:hypothetical protein [Kocuria massiliensis]